MNKEETKKKIIEVLKNSPFKGKLFEGQCEFWANDILDLLEAQKQDLLKKIEGLNRNSEKRSAELECSQEGYEYGLEDARGIFKP